MLESTKYLFVIVVHECMPVILNFCEIVNPDPSYFKYFIRTLCVIDLDVFIGET